MTSVDSRAFEILVRQHHRRLLAFAHALVPDQSVVEDIVQEAFVTAYARLDTFDPSGDFPAWMRAIIRFKCMEWRRIKREVAMPEETLESLDLCHAEWDNNGQSDGRILEALDRCVETLPETMSQVVNLFYFKRLRGRPISDALGISEATIRQRLSRARVILTDCVKTRLQEVDA